ncbi:hypothetical protein PDE_01532 [Penicillium oxalicum 114-2]|uniref:Uncharacterized protein n=1 Tax=Penicillium oxalicum (strain 114-2 / CGMCC 5302) TaxID=933388 RepID=S7Z7N7_PENO1|nr:hypothetical protein PDE_01532 [Penicillium oxalicum 114-2]
MFVGAVCAIADKIAIKICGNGGCGTFPQHKLLAVPSEIIPRHVAHGELTPACIVDGVACVLNLTAGQEEYRVQWSESKINAGANFCVHDIANPFSRQTIDLAVDMINQKATQRLKDSHLLLPVIPVAKVKSELTDARSISSSWGPKCARKHGCGFMDMSAREIVLFKKTFCQSIHFAMGLWPSCVGPRWDHLVILDSARRSRRRSIPWHASEGHHNSFDSQHNMLISLGDTSVSAEDSRSQREFYM